VGCWLVDACNGVWFLSTLIGVDDMITNFSIFILSLSSFAAGVTATLIFLSLGWLRVMQ
jgi:hypothetical protein